MTDSPDGFVFSEDHLWTVPVSAALVRCGISDYAQDALGDVVAVTLPQVGSTVAAGKPCGEIESTKSISELVCPVNGVIAQANDALNDSPELTNSDPYGAGWIFEVTTDPNTLDQQLSKLMDAQHYHDLIGQ